MNHVAYKAGEDYHAAGTKYFAALVAHASVADVSAALDQCILLGEQYRTTLEMLLSALNDSEEGQKLRDGIARTRKLLELLEVELEKFYAVRGKTRTIDDIKN